MSFHSFTYFHQSLVIIMCGRGHVSCHHKRMSAVTVATVVLDVVVGCAEVVHVLIHDPV